MAYQINLTGQEIDERLQNIGTAEDVAAADGTLYARISKNADDVDELRDAVGHIDSAQTATDKTVTQHTADISALQTAVGDVKKYMENAGQVMEITSASVKFATDPNNPVAVFKICNNIGDNGSLCFAGDSHIDYSFKLFRHTGARYEEYPLWVNGDVEPNKKKKIPYTILIDKTSFTTFKPLNIQYGETTEELGNFISNHSKRNKWAIQAYVNGYPYTPLFEFAMSSQKIILKHDLDGNETYWSSQLEKNNGSRYIPRRQNIRLAYAYDSYNWDKVGDAENGLETHRIYNVGSQKEKCYYKMPAAGDIVRRGDKAEGTVMYVNKKAGGTFEMVWSESKKVYTMEFSTYIFDADTQIEYPGMRITKAATLICDDITHQTKGGTLRDLYISAGAKYNEQTGYYELNGLTDITEEEMRVIYNRYLIDIGTNTAASGWLNLDKGERTNLPCITRADIFGSLDNGISGSKVEVLRICAASSEDYIRTCYVGGTMAVAHQSMPKLKKVIGIWRYTNENPNVYYFDYGQPFSKCPLLEEIRMEKINKSHTFAVSPNLSKESVQYMITNANPPSGAAAGSIAITLHPTAYARLKDDADIVAALEAKNGVITLVSA